MIRKVLIIVLSIATVNARTQTLQVHKLNPHYFEYKGKPTVLIASGLHYGAVSNLDIDYDLYLETLDKYGFNVHREFIIPCYEWVEEDKWGSEQTPLSPRPGKLLSPYQRSAEPGAKDGLNKFDLDKWNPLYFEHLKDFCRKADEKGIIIEVVMFTVLYGNGAWETNPLNARNNINGSGNGKYNDYTFLREPGLLDRQKKLVEKVVTELNGFDNVYFEICNEPYWANGIPGGNADVKEQHFLPEVNAWQAEIAHTIGKTEAGLAKRHLIAQNLANTYYKIDTLCHPAVSILNFHYAFPPNTVPDNYNFNLPVAFDETAEGCNAPDRRTEAWAFMMAGGAVYNNLDWSFAIDDQSGLGRNPEGRRRSGVEVKEQLSILKSFFDGLDFIRSKSIESNRIDGIPDNISWWGLENSHELAVYFLKRSNSVPKQAVIEIKGGNYDVIFIDPIDGTELLRKSVSSKENKMTIDFPVFYDDLLLRLIKSES